MENLVVDVYEAWDIAIFDVPGAYFNTDMYDEKYVMLKLECEFLDMMCNVNPYHIPISGKKMEIRCFILGF